MYDLIPSTSFPTHMQQHYAVLADLADHLLSEEELPHYSSSLVHEVQLLSLGLDLGYVGPHCTSSTSVLETLTRLQKEMLEYICNVH